MKPKNFFLPNALMTMLQVRTDGRGLELVTAQSKKATVAAPPRSPALTTSARTSGESAVVASRPVEESARWSEARPRGLRRKTPRRRSAAERSRAVGGGGGGGRGSGGRSIHWVRVGSGGGLARGVEGRRRREEMTMSSAAAKAEAE